MPNERIKNEMILAGVSINELAEYIGKDRTENRRTAEHRTWYHAELQGHAGGHGNREREGENIMDSIEFMKEVAKRKGVSEMTAYRYVNSVMDTIRQVLAEGEEIKIGSFGKFTVVTDLEGNKNAMLCASKSLKQALTAGEGIV